MTDIDKIAKLFDEDAIEKQIAAAIVLGELRAKGPKVMDGLIKLLDSPVPPVQRHALEALTRIGARKALARLFPLLTSYDEGVRDAATRAIASIGEDVVPEIRSRMGGATPETKRALDAVLAELGGDEAFSALLSGLDSTDPEAAKAAALTVRHRVKAADAKQRRSYLAQTEKFLKLKRTEESPATVAAALKIMGYLEDERATPTLLAYATNEKRAASVRMEALIALRFAEQTKKDAAKVVDALVKAAEGTDRTLALTALHTLGSMGLDPSAARRLEKLVRHEDTDRARFAIEQLGRAGGADAAAVLAKVLVGSDKRRAELAAKSLGGNVDAAPLLAKALLETKDVDRAWLVRGVLKPLAKKIKPALRRQLLDAALERLADGERGWEAPLDIARDGDPKDAAEAMRSLAAKLEKGKKDEKAATVLRVLSRSDQATDADRFRLATLELARSRRDTSPAARAGDDSLRVIGSLLGRGFDVAGALRKDRSVGLEEMYYVGFHFAEQGHPLGEELLSWVIDKGGRSKLAKMAKNKLALATRD